MAVNVKQWLFNIHVYALQYIYRSRTVALFHQRTCVEWRGSGNDDDVQNNYERLSHNVIDDNIATYGSCHWRSIVNNIHMAHESVIVPHVDLTEYGMVEHSTWSNAFVGQCLPVVITFPSTPTSTVVNKTAILITRVWWCVCARAFYSAPTIPIVDDWRCVSTDFLVQVGDLFRCF